MSWVDLVVILLALIAAVSGWRHGMAVALLSFVGVLTGAVVIPVAVVGRIRPGQPARLRLEGFPWTQYGTVAATVAEHLNE